MLRPETEHLRPGVNLPYYAPLGPQWWHAGRRYVLGADEAGHDVAVQLLYGGRSALEIGIGSSLICLAGALALGLLAGYRGGAADWLVSRAFDLLWAFPVLLLALALNVLLVRDGWHRRGIDIGAGIAGGTGLYPGIAIVVTVLAVNVLGEALRSALAPR